LKPVGRISRRRNPPTAAPELLSGGLRFANPPYALIGFGVLICIIWFAFGAKTARAIAGAVLIVAALAFAYIMYRIVMGTI
jgi:hypothetical protein